MIVAAVICDHVVDITVFLGALWYVWLFLLIYLLIFELIYWSQTKFVAIILALCSFMRFLAWLIFRLTRLTFLPPNWDKQVNRGGHSGLLDLQLSSIWVYNSPKLFWRHKFIVWRAVLRVWHHPHYTPQFPSFHP